MTYPPGTGSRFLEIEDSFTKVSLTSSFFVVRLGHFVLKTKNSGHYEENEEMMEEKTASRMVSFYIARFTVPGVCFAKNSANWANCSELTAHNLGNLQWLNPCFEKN